MSIGSTSLRVSAQPARRRDWRRMVAEADIAPEAGAVVALVIHRCRLRPRESAAVAEELIAHFADAAACGIAPAQAVADFGDPMMTARLIRRAMHRQRSRAWHLLRWMRRGLVAVLVSYAVLLAYFYCGRPTPTVDYIAQLNQPAIQAPIDQRAWPLYRKAILDMGRPTWDDVLLAPSQGPAWSQQSAFVVAHADAIELTRQAAAKPTLGFILGPHGSIEDPAMYPRRPRSDLTLLDSEDWRFIQDLRRLGIVLCLDARAARLTNDEPRLMSDITALLDMAPQLRPKNASLLESLAGVNIDYWAVEQIDATLVESPNLLTDADLDRLSQAIGQWQSASDMLRLEGDRLIFADLVQHVYTDDGAGDGRITPDGLLRVRLSFAEPGMGDFVAAPLSLLVVASRRQVLEKYDQFVALKEYELRRPARDAAGESARRKLRWVSHPDQLWPAFGVITTFYVNPYIGGSEILLGDRDGVLVGIALERYRRMHGRYPQTLAELTPTWLAEIPADRITGNPVKYLLKASKPLVYSVGADRVDNGGTPGIGMYGPDPTIAALWPPMRVMIPGDWILYPHAR